MDKVIDRADLRLIDNPEQPPARFEAAHTEAAFLASASDQLPSVMPWLAGANRRRVPSRARPETWVVTEQDYQTVRY